MLIVTVHEEMIVSIVKHATGEGRKFNVNASMTQIRTIWWIWQNRRVSNSIQNATENFSSGLQRLQGADGERLWSTPVCGEEGKADGGSQKKKDEVANGATSDVWRNLLEVCKRCESTTVSMKGKRLASPDT